MLLSKLSKTIAIGAMMLSLSLMAFSVVAPVASEARSYRPIRICVRYLTLPWGTKICVEWKTISLPILIPVPKFPPVECPNCGFEIPNLPGPVINPGIPGVVLPGK
jgi:hypothetical protein